VIGLGGIVALCWRADAVQGRSAGYTLSWWVIGTTVAVFVVFFLAVLGRFAARQGTGPDRRASHARPVAEVLDCPGRWVTCSPMRRWQARGTEAFKSGETVEVANMIDLTLVVQRARSHRRRRYG